MKQVGSSARYAEMAFHSATNPPVDLPSSTGMPTASSGSSLTVPLFISSMSLLSSAAQTPPRPCLSLSYTLQRAPQRLSLTLLRNGVAQSALRKNALIISAPTLMSRNSRHTACCALHAISGFDYAPIPRTVPSRGMLTAKVVYQRKCTYPIYLSRSVS